VTRREHTNIQRFKEENGPRLFGNFNIGWEKEREAGGGPIAGGGPSDI